MFAQLSQHPIYRNGYHIKSYGCTADWKAGRAI
jgi:hypothetical protein